MTLEQFEKVRDNFDNFKGASVSFWGFCSKAKKERPSLGAIDTILNNCIVIREFVTRKLCMEHFTDVDLINW